MVSKVFFLFFIESKLFQLVVEEGIFSPLRFLDGENTTCNKFLWARVQHFG